MSALVVQKGLKLATATRTRVAATTAATAGPLGYTSARLRSIVPGGGGSGFGMVAVAGGLVAGGYYYLEEVA